ncbi:MAG: hypothetical protein P8N76_17880 [Pirellulaceae bacterium]|nr:hypothetical protein [Pirellulaceae bacterium]
MASGTTTIDLFGAARDWNQMFESTETLNVNGFNVKKETAKASPGRID